MSQTRGLTDRAASYGFPPSCQACEYEVVSLMLRKMTSQIREPGAFVGVNFVKAKIMVRTVFCMRLFALSNDNGEG